MKQNSKDALKILLLLVGITLTLYVSWAGYALVQSLLVMM